MQKSVIFMNIHNRSMHGMNYLLTPAMHSKAKVVKLHKSILQAVELILIKRQVCT